MPQNRALSNYDTLRVGIDRIAGKDSGPAAPKKPKADPGLTPEMQAAYERRRGSNYGKDINLPKEDTAKPKHAPYSESYSYDWRSRNNLKRGK